MSQEISSTKSSLRTASVRPIKTGRPPDRFLGTRNTPDTLAICVGMLLVIAIAIGGGGVRYGIANLVAQLTALALLAAFRESFFQFWKASPIGLRFLVCATLAVPTVQLIPLPEAIWTSLPGRELAFEARAAIGSKGWAPLSLDSARTVVALTGLIVPLTVLAIGWNASRDQIVALGWIVAAMGLVNLALGVGQTTSSDPMASFYPEIPMQGVLFGTFANRNSAGIFLVCALILCALLPFPRRRRFVLPARVSVRVLLVAAIVLTRSRSALVLCVVPAVLVALKLASSSFRSRDGNVRIRLRFGVLFAGLLLVALAGTSVFVMAPGRVRDVIERFDRSSNPRVYIWEDALYTSDKYWPVGAGMGTFDEVFQADESLENLTQRRAGRAHNDYLEVAIESGMACVILVAAWLAAWLFLTWRARLSSDRWIAWTGSTILLTIALQSIVDYPLRNQAMLSVAALAFLLLARCAEPEEEGQEVIRV